MDAVADEGWPEVGGLNNAWRAAIEGAAEVIVVTDARANVVFVNPGFERVTGYTTAEVLGKNPRLLNSGKQDAAFYRAMWSTLGRGVPWHGRLVNRRKDGTHYTADVTITPVLDAEGRATHFVSTQRDASLEVELSRRLVRQHQAELLESVCGGAVHDLNNLLMVVSGNSQLLEGRIPDDQGELEDIQAAVERARLITGSILAFVRRQPPALAPLDLAAALQGMAPLMRRLLGPRHTLVLSATPGSNAMVRMERGALEQLVLNLVVNAGQAMVDGGVVTMLVTRPGDDVAPNSVDLVIQDTGPGIPAHAMDHIFEPFFTTRPKGTGLGLATVARVVKDAGGAVEVQNIMPHGARFCVRLPWHHV